jgi:hypothetical protein
VSYGVAFWVGANVPPHSSRLQPVVMCAMPLLSAALIWRWGAGAQALGIRFLGLAARRVRHLTSEISRRRTLGSVMLTKGRVSGTPIVDAVGRINPEGAP